ncbi:MAG: FAD-dependent monooxygenase [Candidatus Obscuribacterales bacterium]|nr:FAD-dependent monooxygenase [Candidatus Obscuribacterales bacterium]
MFAKPVITIAGAGLVGSLLSLVLARRGFSVEMFERRADLRKHQIGAGRSINLAISTRGIHALKQVGLDQEVMKYAIPMRGRMIHSKNGDLSLQPYGISDEQCINSISRQILNKILLEHAEATQKVRIHFKSKAANVDFDTKILSVLDEEKKSRIKHQFDVLIGTDGYASTIRTEMMRGSDYQCEIDTLNYGYKELTMPAAKGGGYLMEKNALHIWPRGTFMLIALPNFEGSFTCTLFLPFEGPVSFEKLQTPQDVHQFFSSEFPDAFNLIPNLIQMFFDNPTGHMDTVKCGPWFRNDDVLLIGDAAHAIVPFFGQGMNCGFEDCSVLNELIGAAGDEINWAELFDAFYAKRKNNTDAIADMAVENFVEMRDKVADKHFQLEKAVEKILEKRFPGKYISRYGLVTFSNVDYQKALTIGQLESELLAILCRHIENAEAVDLQHAEELIDKQLAPIITAL